MNIQKIKQVARKRRHLKVRAKISGTGKRPRLCVYRSLIFIYGQLIDDVSGKVLVAVSDKNLDKGRLKKTKVERAKDIGGILAEKALKAGISEVVFDRGGYKYHGRVKALAEEARAKGLKF